MAKGYWEFMGRNYREYVYWRLIPQVRSGPGPKRGNSNLKKEAELSLAPDLLDELPLEKKVITGDALFTQRNFAGKS